MWEHSFYIILLTTFTTLMRYVDGTKLTSLVSLASNRNGSLNSDYLLWRNSSDYQKGSKFTRLQELQMVKVVPIGFSLVSVGSLVFLVSLVPCIFELFPAFPGFPEFPGSFSLSGLWILWFSAFWLPKFSMFPWFFLLWFLVFPGSFLVS